MCINVLEDSSDEDNRESFDFRFPEKYPAVLFRDVAGCGRCGGVSRNVRGACSDRVGPARTGWDSLRSQLHRSPVDNDVSRNIIQGCSAVGITARGGRNAQGREAALLDVLLVVFDASGKAVHQEGQSIDLNLEDAVYEKLLQTGINMTVTSEAPPNSARIRVVVHDVSTGRLGSVDLPMK